MVVNFEIVLAIQLLVMNHKLPHLNDKQDEKQSFSFARFFGAKQNSSLDSMDEERMLLPPVGGAKN